MAQPTPAQRTEHVIRAHIHARNDADANAMAACFGPEGGHDSPVGPTWVGAAIIGPHVAARVREQGHGWTVDQPVIDVDRTPRPPSIPTRRAKHDAMLMMPGAGIRRGALQTRREERLDRPRAGVRWQVMRRRDARGDVTAFVTFPRVS
jgi:hypothetical protein